MALLTHVSYGVRDRDRQSYDTVSHFYPDVFVYVIVSFIVVFFIYGYCSFEDRDDLVDVTLKPYLWLWGVMFLLRGFMVLWTSLPDPSSECTASMTVYWYSFIFVSCVRILNQSRAFSSNYFIFCVLNHRGV